MTVADALVTTNPDGTITAYPKQVVEAVDMPPPNGTEATIHLRGGNHTVRVPAADAAAFLGLQEWPPQRTAEPCQPGER